MIDHDDWGITDTFFEFIDDLWGPHSVDRFASVVNKKISRFNSLFWNPSSEAIDAFTQNWSGENNFLVPPIYSVVRAIKHLVYSKTIGTLIIPRWVSAPYWLIIFKKHMQYQNYVTDVLEFAECDRIYVKGSSPYCIFGTEKIVSPVLTVRLDARWFINGTRCSTPVFCSIIVHLSRSFFLGQEYIFVHCVFLF